MGKTRQQLDWHPGNVFSMAERIRILTIERDGEDGLIVTFSDETTAGYVAEELLQLRPSREPTPRPMQTLSDPRMRTWQTLNR
jgi:hypothetical protein